MECYGGLVNFVQALGRMGERPSVLPILASVGEGFVAP